MIALFAYDIHVNCNHIIICFFGFVHLFTVCLLSVNSKILLEQGPCLSYYHMPRTRAMPNARQVLSTHFSSDYMND